MGETALHLAILREMGDSLHLVDFLVQNMSSSGLDKPTLLVQDNLGEYRQNLACIQSSPLN